MRNEGRAAVETWADRALHELTTADFAQVDLDDLLREPPALAVEAAMNLLQWAVAKARRVDPDVDGIVTIPLPWSVSLSHDSPSLADLVAQPWEYGPGLHVPGLYLVNPGNGENTSRSRSIDATSGPMDLQRGTPPTTALGRQHPRRKSSTEPSSSGRAHSPKQRPPMTPTDR